MALVDHILVLSHLQPQVISGPPTQSWEETLRKLGMEEHIIAALPPSARQQPMGMAGEATTSNSALSFSPAGIVTEVDWPCGCGKGLHAHYEEVLAAWARHVAALEGIDADHLEQHAVQSITGAHPLVVCLCGTPFPSDGYLRTDALRAWEAHVRGM